MTIKFIMDEDTYNELDRAKSIVTTLYDLAVQTQGDELALNAEALMSTLGTIHDQLNQVTQQTKQYIPRFPIYKPL